MSLTAATTPQQAAWDAQNYGPSNPYAATGMSGSQLLQSQINSGQMNNPAPAIGKTTPWTNGNAAFGNAPQPANLRQDWANNPYWNTTKAGDVTQYGGGQLLRNADGSTTYSQQGQNPYTFNQSTDPATIAQNSQGIANEWSKTYGQGAWGSPQSQPSQNLGMGSSTPATASAPSNLGQNPWLQQQGQALQAMSNQNLKQNILPGIGQGAQAAGMYGSSRQGIAEGQAMANAQTGLNNALANMYSQSYGQDQNYDLGLKGAANQAQGIANSYNLGLGNLALGNKQSDNAYNLGLGQQALGYANLDSNNAQFGANYGLQSQNYQNQWANNNALTANAIARTPLDYFNTFNNNANQIAGQGGTSSQTNQGNPWMTALGGAQLASQFYK